MKKKTEKILIWTGLLTSAAAAGAVLALLFKIFLPSEKPEKEKAEQKKWPWALLLGCPAHDDGTMPTSQIRRCNLAIKAWEDGLYENLIISGGKVRNSYGEAETMAAFIRANGGADIPILMETHARNTWENIKNTRLLIGDQPILILTSSLHARRTAAMARHSFSDFALVTYPDYKPKHILREIFSRLLYIRLEIKKLFTLA